MPQSTSQIGVKHNIEVAHRLYELPGKCEQIHGHSMWVTMKLKGPLNSHGILAGIEYGDLKKTFRRYLDETYDHRLLLNKADPFAGPMWAMQESQTESHEFDIDMGKQLFLPGLQVVMGDPTTENIAKWVALEMREKLNGYGIWNLSVEVWETSVNFGAFEINGTDGMVFRRASE